MLDYPKTISILSGAYEDCLKFWKREKHPQATELAKKDIERMTTNPFSPSGEELNKEAKQVFIKILDMI